MDTPFMYHTAYQVYCLIIQFECRSRVNDIKYPIHSSHLFQNGTVHRIRIGAYIIVIVTKGTLAPAAP